MTKILLTGFEPFGGAASNPSWEAVQLVAARWGGGAELRVACLPTTFAGSVQRLGELIEGFGPEIVVATGMAQGRTSVTPEVVAINLIDARIPDNDGDRPRDVRVVEDGPDAYFSGLPIKPMVAAMRAAGVPSTLSYSAGTFVCNHVFFGLMHMLRTRYPAVRAGFVHVPATPAEVFDGSCPTLSVDSIATGLLAGLLACLIEDGADVETGTIA